MIDGKFDVVFRGQIVKGFELTDVKANLMKLFKSSPEAVERLFGGKEVTIRKDLDYAGAMKYQSALKGSGALALIKEQEVAQSQANQNQVKTGKAQFNQPQDDPAQTVPESPAYQQKSANLEQSSHSDSSSLADSSVDQTAGLTIAATGAQILPKKVYENRDVDTSELSLATPGERLLPNKVYEKRDIDTSGLSLDD